MPWPKQVRKPQYLKDLELYGYDYDWLVKIQQWFWKRGISVGKGTRGLNFSCVGRMDGPTNVICWVGIEQFIEMAVNRIQTVKMFWEKGANVAIRKER